MAAPTVPNFIRDTIMLIIPAIDLLDGKCVRLKQGVEGSAKIYSDRPVDMALQWQDSGAQLLHVVNLDGAFGRSAVNADVIQDIVKSVHIPVQMGGGVRSLEDMASWLELGVARVILGTVALTNKEIVWAAIAQFGADSVVVGIDSRDDKVAIRGWEQQTQTDALHFALHMKSIGVRRIIHTDVSRDGENSGPNLKSTAAMAEQTQLRIIASGGFSRLEHFQELSQLKNPFIEGAIVGTALYEKALDFAALNALMG